MLPSGLPEQVEANEEISRFLIHRKHFNAVMVKPAAFLPNPKDGETSVFRVGAENEEELWSLGEFAAGENRTLYGAAILRASDIRRVGLRIESHEPPKRHAAIVDWPWQDDRDLQKAEQKRLAIQLASAAGAPITKKT